MLLLQKQNLKNVYPLSSTEFDIMKSEFAHMNTAPKTSCFMTGQMSSHSQKPALYNNLFHETDL